MKMSLLAVCLIGTGFFALSSAHAAPFGGGFNLRSVHSAGMGGFAGGGRRVFFGREFRASSAFRHGNHFFFHQPTHRFFPASNVVAFGLPVWYPDYDYYWNPDGYLQNDNGSYGPDSDYQYSDGSAAQAQSAPTLRPNNNPITVVINAGSPQPVGPQPVSPQPIQPSYGGSPNVSNEPGEQDKNVTPEPNQPTEAPPLPLVPPTAPVTKGGVFGNLVLVSWLNDAGKDVIYVKNTETSDVERITSEPNNDQFRIVAIHPDPDPKLFEVVISNGKEQGAVRFRSTAAAVVKSVTN